MIQNIVYAPFDRVQSISEGAKSLNFTYDPELNRIKTVLTDAGTVTETKYFIGNYEKIITPTGTKEIHYIPTGNGTDAVYVLENGVGSYYFLYKDHLGSIVSVTNISGTVVYEQNFDAWGKRRNATDWLSTPVLNSNFSWLRGFTGHEHLDDFGLINMNNRLYDPVIGRMCGVDNFVQNPYFTQNYNRYSYVYNNPLSYTDPSGEIILFFTEFGYDLQKNISPIAFNIDINLGTHKKGIGVNSSIGLPQALPGNIRFHGGIAYNWKNYDVTPGWETKKGFETGITPFTTIGSTTYNNPGTKFDQKTGEMKIGVPGLNIKYANDWFFDTSLGDNGDRYRTAAAKIQIGSLSIGINLFTGDPGLENRLIDKNLGGKNGQYKTTSYGDNPDEFRAGVGYIGIGIFRFGNDSEKRRHNIQNILIHDKVSNSPHFKVLNIPNKMYFQFGGGSNLW